MSSRGDKSRRERGDDYRSSDHGDGGVRSRNYGDRQNSSRHHRGHGHSDKRGEEINQTSRNYTQHDSSSRHNRKRSRSLDRDRDRGYHGSKGPHRDHYNPERKRGEEGVNYSRETGSYDSNKRPYRKGLGDTEHSDLADHTEAADNIDEEDLHPVPLKISCPAASSLVQQIEKRKLLFSKKEAPTTSASGSSSVWQKTTFSDDSDGKVSAKFKRLMGMKDGGDNLGSKGDSKDTPVPATQSKDFFNKLEKEYEVARTITHTQRGVGLGFGSSSGGLVPKTTWTNRLPQ